MRGALGLAGTVIALGPLPAMGSAPGLQPTRLPSVPPLPASFHVLELVGAAPLQPQPAPVERLGRTWMLATGEVVGGRAASTAFRSPSAELGVRWALAAASVPTLPPDRDAELRLLGVVATAASQGWESTLSEATRRNPTLHKAHQTLKVLSGGGVDVRKKRGETRTRLDPKRRRPDQAEASIEAPPPSRLRRRKRVPVVFRAGGGLRMRWLDPKERSSTLGRPGLTGYVQARQLGVDELQLSFWQLSGETLWSRMPAEWSLSARERLGHVDSLVLQASGVEGRGVPAELRLGWEHRLPGKSRWRLGPYVERGWRGKGPYVVESTVGLELRQDASWRVPQRPGQWPLGKR